MEINLFDELYKFGKRFFTTQGIFFKKIPDDIYKYINITHDIELKETCIIKNIDELNTSLNLSIYLISDPKIELEDSMIYNSKFTIISVLPESKLSNDNISLNNIYNIIYAMYSYWIKIIRQMYPIIKDSNLDKIFTIAPAILSLKILDELYGLTDLNFTDLLNDEEISLGMSPSKFKDCLSCNISNLLDRGGVIAILNDKENENK